MQQNGEMFLKSIVSAQKWMQKKCFSAIFPDGILLVPKCAGSQVCREPSVPGANCALEFLSHNIS